MVQVLDLTNPCSTFKYCSFLTHWKKIKFDFNMNPLLEQVGI